MEIEIMNIKGRLAGLFLIGIGILLLSGKYLTSDYSSERLLVVFWPSFTVLFIGLLLHLFYLLFEWKGSIYLLIPGGILVTFGILFQIAMLNDAWVYVWPGFILAPAVGLTEYYLFGGRPKWALIPIIALTSVSFILILVFTVGKLVDFQVVQWGLAFLFIVFGLFILFRGKPKRSIGR